MTEDKVYRWETGYEVGLSVLKSKILGKDDVNDNIEKLIHDYENSNKRRKDVLTDDIKSNNRLGMLRHVYIIIDISKASLKQDYKPTRVSAIINELNTFIKIFYDQNPLGTIGIITTKDRKAIVQCPLGSQQDCKNVLKEVLIAV